MPITSAGSSVPLDAHDAGAGSRELSQRWPLSANRDGKGRAKGPFCFRDCESGSPNRYAKEWSLKPPPGMSCDSGLCKRVSKRLFDPIATFSVEGYAAHSYVAFHCS
jgi:hypothetical protein